MSVPTEITSGNGITTTNFNITLGCLVPVGAVIAFLKSLTSCPALPDNFVECNGQTLSDAESPFDGVTIPNLNASGGGTQRYLRGATTSGSTGGADSVTLTTTELPAHNHSIAKSGQAVGNDGSYPVCDSTTSGSINTANNGTGSAFSILNSYYTVVWIMRIK